MSSSMRLGEYLGSRRTKQEGSGENYILLLTNTIRVIKSRIIKWARHVECMGERCIQEILVGKLEGKSHLEDAGVDVRIILRWIFTQWNGGRGPH
jgi:hypothetical protein